MDKLQQEKINNLCMPINMVRVKYTTIENKKPSNKGVIVLTNLGLEIREDNKSSKLKQQFNWINLNKVNKSNEFFRFIFKQRKDLDENVNNCPTEQIIFKLQDENQDFYTDFIECFTHLLPRLLRSSELKNTSFNLLKSQTSNPSTFSTISRLTMFRQLQNSTNCQMSFDILETIILNRQNYINLAIFNDIDIFIQVIFQMLPFLNFVEIIKIPYLKKLQFFQYILNFFPELYSLKYIEINGPRDDGFNAFHQILTNSPLLAVSYSESDFSSDELNIIHDSLLSANIHCVEFHNAINDISSDFYTNFLNTEMRRNLWSLNMDQTLSIDISKLTTSFERLCSLSLSNCGLDIINVLSSIQKNHLYYLTYLNLSGNTCTHHFDPNNIHLPSSLTHIMVNEVSWNEKSLIRFFMLILRLNESYTPPLLSLSMANAITLPHEWTTLFTFLKQQIKRRKPIETSNSLEISEICERQKNLCIQKLIWDGNPVDKNFFDFLNENKNLETLFLNNCFNETVEDSISLLTKFIQSNETITHLSISGSKTIYLGQKVSDVINSCKGKHNLSILDLSFSRCGSNNLQYFLPLFEEGNNSLSTVILDGTFPEDPNSFVDFLKRINEITILRNAKYHPRLSFPENDYQLLINQQKLTQDDIREIQSLYMTEYQPDTENSDNLFDQPMNYYKYFYEPFIPFYLTLDDVDLIYSKRLEEEQIPSKLIGIEHDNEIKDINDLLLNIQTLENDSNDSPKPKKAKKPKKKRAVKFNKPIHKTSDDDQPLLQKRQLKSLLQSSMLTSTIGDESHISLILNRSSDSYEEEEEEEEESYSEEIQTVKSPAKKNSPKKQIFNENSSNDDEIQNLKPAKKKHSSKTSKQPISIEYSSSDDQQLKSPKKKHSPKKQIVSESSSSDELEMKQSIKANATKTKKKNSPKIDQMLNYIEESSSDDYELQKVKPKLRSPKNKHKISPKADQKRMYIEDSSSDLNSPQINHSPISNEINSNDKQMNQSNKRIHHKLSPKIDKKQMQFVDSSDDESDKAIRTPKVTIKTNPNDEYVIEKEKGKIKTVIIPRQVESRKEDKPFELSQDNRNLIDKFIRQNQLNEEEFQCAQFAVPDTQSDVWTTINKEFSIDVLYQKIKNEKR